VPNVGRKAPDKSHTQSVLFDQKSWTKTTAKSWLKEHGYQVGGLDETEGKLRFRQYDPESSKFRYRNKSAGKGITLVLGFPNKKRTVVIKGDGDEIILYGPFYPPWLVDTDKEAMLPEEVQKAAEKFAKPEYYQNVDIIHNGKPTGSKILNVFIADKGNPYWLEGEMIAEVKPGSPEIVEMAQKGELNGFSFKGEVTRTPEIVLLRHPTIARGDVEKSEGGPLDPHDHDLELFFDDDAKLIPTFTAWNMGHRHVVKGTTATEKAFDHAHRYIVNE
jgi:hypothetical protein